MRLLIVAFYFPPTGGGLQRTLKFRKIELSETRELARVLDGVAG
jgi:hypothetical protein